jgi:dTDP-4-dehydrorhamnose reductase/UDP-glucose 4-epimerase
MSRELLVVGRGSFLAREFLASGHAEGARTVAHVQADDARVYDGVRCVINVAFAPALHDAAYDPALDVDAVVAKHAVARRIHYVMMSSRRVYQRAMQWNASEAAPAIGLDAYGRNKLRIESALRELLGERLTVLRPGNVVGYEPIPGRMRFGAYLQNQLLETGRIRLTVHPTVRRDLVPVDFFCRVLGAACSRRISGTFNVGAGHATEVGRAAEWLIEGFGAGDLLTEGAQGGDDFQLDSSRLAAVFGLACPADALERTMRDAGRRLGKERARRAGIR